MKQHQEAMIAGFILGAVVMLFICSSYIFFNTPAINCPQEDMCYYDYYDGAPHIFRVDD